MNRVDDVQVGLMGCICDAEAILMKEKGVSEVSQESYFAHWSDIAFRANDAKYFGALRDFSGADNIVVDVRGDLSVERYNAESAEDDV